MLDIMIARLTHVEWSDQLEQALRMKRTQIMNVRSCNECELGIWLYSEALREYRDIPEIQLLEQNHKAFHAAAEKVVSWHNKPKISPQRDAQAQADFEEAQRKSKEIIFGLTMLEYKLLRNHKEHAEASESDVKDTLLHPLRMAVIKPTIIAAALLLFFLGCTSACGSRIQTVPLIKDPLAAHHFYQISR